MSINGCFKYHARPKLSYLQYAHNRSGLPRTTTVPIWSSSRLLCGQQSYTRGGYKYLYIIMPGIYSLGIQVSRYPPLRICFGWISLLPVYVFGLLLSAGHSYFLTSSLSPSFQFFLPPCFHSPYTVFLTVVRGRINAQNDEQNNRSLD